MSKKVRPTRIGVVMLATTLVVSWMLFSKDRIDTALSSGETITVHFEQDYKLRPHVSKVKVGFVPVGKVSGVERTAEGTATVSLKVEEDALDKLGSAPSAIIRPTTLLGGSYFVDLQAGGDPGVFSAREIPIERTRIPVELDKVARALQPGALKGLQSTVDNLNGTFDRDGAAALERLVKSAPETLRPTRRVLRAAQGTHRHSDLASLTAGLEGTARALTERRGQMRRVLANLRTVSGTLDRRSPELGTTLDRLPSTLRNTEAGLRGLGGTLNALEDVSARTRPVARELRDTLMTLDPVIEKARPVVRDLRVVVRDARPLAENLFPTAQSARDVLRDVRGPVLDRVNGPVLDWLHADYDGSGKYSLTKSERPMYQEVVYMFANGARAAGLSDKNGHAVGFQPGIGTGSVGGLPISLEQYVKTTTAWYYPDTPQETMPPLEGSGSPLLDDVLGTLLGRRN